MVHQQQQRLRLAFALVCSASILMLIVLACGPGAVLSKDTLTYCAFDPVAAACGTGAFQQLSATQTIQINAKDSGGHALATTLTVSVSGANARTGTIHTDSAGAGTYTYSGANAGTDTISISEANGNPVHTPHPLVIHWVNTPHVAHPMIFLHGISEDAQVYAKKTEWTGTFEALDLVYDPSLIQPFCYVDDKAWASNPSVCPSSDTQSAACVDASTCISQSSVDDNAVALAKAVSALALLTGKKVTLLGYSMGAAIIRTMLANCPRSSSTDAQACIDVTSNNRVDAAFFFNGVQQGSWLMHVKQSWDAANLALADTHVPLGLNGPFAAILPVIEQAIFSAVKTRMGGLDANQVAAADLAPQSLNILAHNEAVPAIPSNVLIYTFYGDIRLQMGFTNLVYHLPGQNELPLGDLVLLAQNDPVADIPAWGGAALCDQCNPADSFGYQNSGGSGPLSGQYHAWALFSPASFDIGTLVPMLTDSSANQGLPVLGSPATHMNITQPWVQAAGSPLQVEDITHPGHTTDMPAEVLAILMSLDGIPA